MVSNTCRVVSGAFGEQIVDRLQEHQHTVEALQERVVQLSGDAFALGHPRSQPHTDPGGGLPPTKPIKAREEQPSGAK